MKRTIYVCPDDSCIFLSMTPGQCRSHPYPLRAMGPDLMPIEVEEVDTRSVECHVVLYGVVDEAIREAIPRRLNLPEVPAEGQEIEFSDEHTDDLAEVCLRVKHISLVEQERLGYFAPYMLVEVV